MPKKTSALLLAGLLLVALGCGDKQDGKFTSAQESFAEAQQAIEQGDTAKAISALTTSLDTLPTVTVYLERAKLYAADGKQEEALQDCQAALELSPDNRDAKWLLTELKKPAEKRFEGKNENPPSSFEK